MKTTMTPMGHGRMQLATAVRRAFLLSSVAFVTAASASAMAQTASTPPSTSPAATPPQQASAIEQEAPEGAEEIVVTGIRASLEDALATKRNADVILDGISSDDLGNFPDLNLGEALQRIPGVQINREAERRNATISVRGLPGQYTKTTVMGQNIASPTRGDAVAGFQNSQTNSSPFGSFESSVFSGANIIKSFSADIQSGGLAANADLQIRPALSRKDGQFVVRAEVGYEQLTEKFSPSLFASGSKHFADDTIGVFATVAYSKQRFRRDSINVASYGSFSTAATRPGLSFASFDPNPAVANDYNVLYPGDVRQFTEQSDGYRISAASGLEIAISDGLTFRTDALFTRRDLSKNTLDIFSVAPNGSEGQVTPRGGLDGVKLAGNFDIDANGDLEKIYYAPAIDFVDPLFIPGRRTFPLFEQTWGIYPRLVYSGGGWKADVTGTLSRSRTQFEQEQFDVRYRPLGAAAAGPLGGSNGISGFYNTGSGNIGNYQLQLNVPPNVPNLLAAPLRLVGTNDQQANVGTSATATSLLLASDAQRVKRDLKSIEANIERELDFGPLSALKTGARFERETSDAIAQSNSLLGTNLAAVDNTIFTSNSALTSGGTFFGGTAPGIYTGPIQSIDIDKLKSQLLPLGTVPAGAVLNELTGFYQRRQGLAAFAPRNFSTERRTFEAYGMARFEIDNFAETRTRGNVGVRYVRTTLEGNITSLPNPADTGRGRYETWLPSVNILSDLTDKLVLGLAYYKTFETPNLGDFSPAPTIAAFVNDTPGEPSSLTIDFTDLDLEPRRAENFDINLSWYNRPGSVVGVAYFRKNFVDIVNVRSCPEEGVTVGSLNTGPLFLDTNQICRQQTNNPVQELNPRATLLRLANTTTPIIIHGVEFQVQQSLKGLVSAPWDGFGASFNYTYVTGKSDTGQLLTGVSKHSYNLITYYETKLFSVRAATNYRSTYRLPAGSSFSGSDRSVRGRVQLDLSAAVRPATNLELRLEAFNVTGAIREEYQFVRELARRTDYDGRTYQLGVQYSF